MATGKIIFGIAGAMSLTLILSHHLQDQAQTEVEGRYQFEAVPPPAAGLAVPMPLNLQGLESSESLPEPVRDPVVQLAAHEPTP